MSSFAINTFVWAATFAIALAALAYVRRNLALWVSISLLVVALAVGALGFIGDELIIDAQQHATAPGAAAQLARLAWWRNWTLPGAIVSLIGFALPTSAVCSRLAWMRGGAWRWAAIACGLIFLTFIAFFASCLCIGHAIGGGGMIG